jgi:hypothetical protein
MLHPFQQCVKEVRNWFFMKRIKIDNYIKVKRLIHKIKDFADVWKFFSVEFC